MVPASKRKMIADGQPRFGHIEIEICSHCDCNCFGCDRFIDVAPTSPMTVEQIGCFVAESLALEWEWKRVHILGGEPTLHPQFPEIVERLMEYRQAYPEVLLRVISNGRGKIAEYMDRLEEQHINVSLAIKLAGKPPEYFDNMHIAPLDKDPDCGPLPPCGIYGTYGCGLGLTKHGYFLCGAGASIARVVGADIGVMYLADVTHAAMAKQAETLCNLCGHWSGPTTDTLAQTGEVSGPFWRKAIATYRESIPTMSIYGVGDA